MTRLRSVFLKGLNLFMARSTPKPSNIMFSVSAGCFACTCVGLKAFFIHFFLKWMFLHVTSSVLFVISLKTDRNTILLVPVLALSRSHPSAIFIPPLWALCGLHHYKSRVVYKYIATSGFYLLNYIWVGESPLSEGSQAAFFAIVEPGKKNRLIRAR